MCTTHTTQKFELETNFTGFNRSEPARLTLICTAITYLVKRSRDDVRCLRQHRRGRSVVREHTTSQSHLSAHATIDIIEISDEKSRKKKKKTPFRDTLWDRSRAAHRSSSSHSLPLSLLRPFLTARFSPLLYRN